MDEGIGRESIYWVIPNENGLFEKTSIGLIDFLEKAGYIVKDEEKGTGFYKNDKRVAQVSLIEEGFHVEFNMQPNLSNSKIMRDVLDFIDLLRANNLKYSEGFNRKQAEGVLENERELSHNLIKRLQEIPLPKS